VPSENIISMHFDAFSFSAEEDQAMTRDTTHFKKMVWPTARKHAKTSRLSIFDYSDYANGFTDIWRTHVRDVR
jgi:hypothetical protein